jgi:hypothetical protein
VNQENTTNPPAAPAAVSRRQAMQWVMAAVAASSLPGRAFGQNGAPADQHALRQEHALPQKRPAGQGYGSDPNLVKIHTPGDFWPLVMTPEQRSTATALADVILPNDQYGPAASQLGVVPMVDEWISAPYPEQQGDRPVIVNGLQWIEAESNKRFGKRFPALSDQQKHAICDDICYTRTAKPEFRQAAGFFSRFRSLCAAAYYATPAGWKAIGYVGNTPLEQFDGPPPEVLERLGVTQTVK